MDEKIILKNRADDFKGESDHLEDLLSGNTKDPSISVERGLDTMLVISAAHISSRLKRTVYIDYDKGYCPEAIQI